MTTELEMLLWVVALTIVMWIPYVLAHIANVGVMEALTYRGDGTPLPAWAERAKKAHRNAIENLVPFATLVIAADFLAVTNEATVSAAMVYFWCRAAHFVLYTLNVPFGRTLAFTGGWLAQLCLLYQILSVNWG